MAKAIVEAYDKGSPDYPVDHIDVIKGGGIKAQVDNKTVLAGNVKLLESMGVVFDRKQKDLAKAYEKSGNSIISVAIEGELKALIGIRDKVRLRAKEKLQELKDLGAKNLIILSGDKQGSVDIIKEEIGLTEAYGNLLPEDKADFVTKLKERGLTVAFIGDGIIDTPSLALADVGIAMGSGTDVAIEVSDVVLMNSDITRLPHAYDLVKATCRNMVQNIVIAVGVVIFLLTSLIFSDWMNMSIGMFVHEGSILAVILNGIRLINYNVH